MATHQLNRLAGLLNGTYAATRLGTESDATLLDRCRKGDDPAAFEALVRRHGSRVLAACRKVLRDPADVEDAFQATFLVLLQKPRAVRKADAVGSWLYGVAHRIAVRARDTVKRRGTLLKKAGPPREEEAAPDLSWREACDILHFELDRLPDSQRLPLLLCYLEGLSRDEAARRLGWTLSEVRGRLERGRLRLRDRLSRRGIALSAALFAAVAGDSVTAGVPPARLIESALRAAAGQPSAKAAALVHGASAMSTPLKMLAGLVLLAGGLVSLSTQHPRLGAQPKSEPAKPVAKEISKPADFTPPEFAGRVLDHDGKPVKGAKIHVLYYTPKTLPVPERGITDADGKFRFAMKATDFERSYVQEPWSGAHVVARADGFALGWAIAKGRDGELTIRLPKDDTPLTGRLLSLEGKPLAGVTVRLQELLAPLPGKTDLAGLTTDLKKRNVGYAVLRDYATGFEGTWIGRDVGTLFPSVTTGDDGRFTIRGVGAERLATLRFERAGIESRTLRVLTREAESVTVPEWDRSEGPTMTFVGNGFDYTLAPGRTVTGVVRDKATGKPIAGAVVVSERTAGNPVSGRAEFRAVADRDGKYLLHGLPLGNGNVLVARPPGDEPYLMQSRDVPVPAGFNPAPLDFELTRGIVLTVKPLDAETSKPVAGFAEYFTFPDNPAYRAIKGFTMPRRDEGAAQDGWFRLVVPPGPGLVAFRARDDRYPVGIGHEQFKDRRDRIFIKTVPHLLHVTNYHVVHPVEPKPDSQVLEVTLRLAAGKSVSGRVLDPDGKPLAGTAVRGLNPSPTVFGTWERALPTERFDAISVDANKPRAILFLHPDRKLAGMVRVRGDEKRPIEVKLQPWATLTGRLLNADGKPLADVRLTFMQNVDEADPSGVGDLPDREIRTDAQGRFQLVGLVPGLRYNLSAVDARRVLARVGDNMTFKAGEAKDVGDVTARPGE
jgi:RNA polymerase sigma factor (sigma-70 family)